MRGRAAAGDAEEDVAVEARGRAEPLAAVGGRHVPELDGLRGIAIALVLVCHVVVWGGIAPTRFDARVERIFSHGDLGVDLFFVLSGYLITGGLLDTRGRRGYAVRFYGRRALRIFPLYVVFLLGAMVVVPAVLPVSASYRALVGDQVWFWTYLTNVGVVVRGGWDPFLAFGHFWSLAVEEQFYLVWPIVVGLLPPRWFERVCAALVGVAFVTSWALGATGHPLAAYTLLPANAAGLAVGALLAVWQRGRGLPTPRVASWVAAAGVPVAGAAALWSDGGSGLSAAAKHLSAAVLFGALVAMAVAGPVRGTLGRVLRAGPLRSLGTYSYGIYVLHLPVLFVVVRVAGWPATRFPTLAGTDVPGIVVLGVVMLAGSVALALVSWRVIERPFLSLKDRLPMS